MARILRVKVKPNARHPRLEALAAGSWLAAVAAPPVDGKANAAVIELIAEHFSVPRSRVSIKSGAAARMKHVLIND